MRPAILLSGLALGALAIPVIVGLLPNATTPHSALFDETIGGESSQANESQTHEPSSLRQVGVPPDNALPQLTNMAAQVDESTAADTKEDEDRVQARVAELFELSSKLAPAALETLLAEVRNQNPEIRQAALDAISQSGNRTLIPRLLQAAEETEDADQRRAIAETVEFLNLPTLSEVMSETNNP